MYFCLRVQGPYQILEGQQNGLFVLLSQQISGRRGIVTEDILKTF